MAHGRTILVSRHVGTRSWLEGQGRRVDLLVGHLDPNMVEAGDLVIGNLPLHLAAQVNGRGARLLHLALDLAPEDRGRELTEAEIEARCPRLLPLRVVEDHERDEVYAATPRARSRGARTLITLLGAPARGQYGVFEHSYRTLSLTAGWLPQAVIAARTQAIDPIDRVIVIGTPGSGWDMLARLAGLERSDLEFDLFAAMDGDGVTQQHADALADPIRALLGVEDVALVVAPYAGDAGAATQMVARLGDLLAVGERVVFDVTFGMRDTMLTAFTAVTALKSLRDIELEEVVYAAITSQRPNHVTVRGIEAVPRMLEWVEALSLLDTAGDMRPLAAVIGETPDLARLLARQQQDERLLRPRRAAQSAQHVLALLERSTAPLARLFRDAVHRRLSWARKAQTLSTIQASLAQTSLQHGDLLRAVALAFEACVSAYGEERHRCSARDLEDPRRRRDLQAELNDDVRHRRQFDDLQRDEDYLLLRETRNLLLHASAPQSRRLASLLEEPDQIVALVERVCARLLGEGRQSQP